MNQQKDQHFISLCILIFEVGIKKYVNNTTFLNRYVTVSKRKGVNLVV
jgi:hypothetical protein